MCAWGEGWSRGAYEASPPLKSQRNKHPPARAIPASRPTASSPMIPLARSQLRPATGPAMGAGAGAGDGGQWWARTHHPARGRPPPATAAAFVIRRRSHQRHWRYFLRHAHGGMFSSHCAPSSTWSVVNRVGIGEVPARGPRGRGTGQAGRGGTSQTPGRDKQQELLLLLLLLLAAAAVAVAKASMLARPQ